MYQQKYNKRLCAALYALEADIKQGGEYPTLSIVQQCASMFNMMICEECTMLSAMTI